MPGKRFPLNEHITVVIYKRRSNRSLRLSVTPQGEVRVTIPAWAPYKAGLGFARSKQDWIQQQKRPAIVLESGQLIGKAHSLQIVASETIDKVSCRVSGDEVIVKHPVTLTANAALVQNKAQKAAIKALRMQAEELLPRRLMELAHAHGFEHKSVRIKQLKSRWGSCDSRGNIVLNLFLMQLPWECIDYVLLHELTHTKVLRHGPPFWRAMEEVVPNVSYIRQRMRQHQPVLQAV